MKRTMSLPPRRITAPELAETPPEEAPTEVGYDSILAERLLEAVRPTPSQTPIERKETRREPYQLD